MIVVLAKDFLMFIMQIEEALTSVVLALTQISDVMKLPQIMDSVSAGLGCSAFAQASRYLLFLF